MKICIVGTGAAGWLACNFVKNLDYVDEVVVIGSSKIPTIGVGESNTLLMTDFIDELISRGEFSIEDFIVGTNAVFKYGVMYEGWSRNKFIHYLKNSKEFSLEKDNYSTEYYSMLLANKDPQTHIHSLMGRQIFEEVQKNNIMLEQTTYPHSYHFDANRFIDFMGKNALKNKKVSIIDDKVLGGNKKDDEVVELYTEQHGTIAADFFIFATGDYKINEEFLEIKYQSYSDVLLTNKAIAYPLPFTNKRDQFTPYTLAKTMKNGWRWITPTWERIGTGYVFSDNYISVDQAVNEFRKDIGDESIEPFVVDFKPRKNPNNLHINWCTLGMASGFLEPLDAPGLTMAIGFLTYQINHYLEYLHKFKNNVSSQGVDTVIEKLNYVMNEQFNFWATFILAQYKTSNRYDSEFWKDHHSVQWNFYDEIMENMDRRSHFEMMMLRQTIAAKDITWDTQLKCLPYKTFDTDFVPVHHYDYISNIWQSRFGKE